MVKIVLSNTRIHKLKREIRIDEERGEAKIILIHKSGTGTVLETIYTFSFRTIIDAWDYERIIHIPVINSPVPSWAGQCIEVTRPHQQRLKVFRVGCQRFEKEDIEKLREYVNR